MSKGGDKGSEFAIELRGYTDDEIANILRSVLQALPDVPNSDGRMVNVSIFAVVNHIVEKSRE